MWKNKKIKCNTNRKTADVTTLISDKGDFKTLKLTLNIYSNKS